MLGRSPVLGQEGSPQSERHRQAEQAHFTGHWGIQGSRVRICKQARHRGFLGERRAQAAASAATGLGHRLQLSRPRQRTRHGESSCVHSRGVVSDLMSPGLALALGTQPGWPPSPTACRERRVDTRRRLEGNRYRSGQYGSRGGGKFCSGEAWTERLDRELRGGERVLRIPGKGGLVRRQEREPTAMAWSSKGPGEEATVDGVKGGNPRRGEEQAPWERGARTLLHSFTHSFIPGSPAVFVP